MRDCQPVTASKEDFGGKFSLLCVLLPARPSEARAMYSTSKDVKLLDRRLGVLNLTIYSLILLYVLGVRIWLERRCSGHMDGVCTKNVRASCCE